MGKIRFNHSRRDGSTDSDCIKNHGYGATQKAKARVRAAISADRHAKYPSAIEYPYCQQRRRDACEIRVAHADARMVFQNVILRYPRPSRACRTKLNFLSHTKLRAPSSELHLARPAGGAFDDEQPRWSRTSTLARYFSVVMLSLSLGC